MLQLLYNLINPIGKRIKKAFSFLETQFGFKELSKPDKRYSSSVVEYFNGKYWIAIFNDYRESYLEIGIYKYDKATNKLIIGERGEYTIRLADILAELEPDNTDKMFNNYEANTVEAVIERSKSLLEIYLRKHPEII